MPERTIRRAAMTAAWLTLKFTNWSAVMILFCMLTLCASFADRVVRKIRGRNDR